MISVSIGYCFKKSSLSCFHDFVSCSKSKSISNCFTFTNLNSLCELHQLSTGSFSCAVNFDKADMLKWSNKLFGFDFPISCHLRLIQGCSIRRLDWKFDNLASFTNSVFWLLSTGICHVAAGLEFVSLIHSRILCHDSCIVLGWTGIFQIDSFTNCVSWLLHRPVAAGLEILLKSGWVTLDPECLPLIGGKLPLIMSVCTWWGDNCPQSTKVCMKQVWRIFTKDKKAQCGEKCSCLEICRVAAGLEIFDKTHSLTNSASRF